MANIPSSKRNLIDKANTTVVIFVSVAAFLVIFSLVATKTLVNQANYLNRVIREKRAVKTTLEQNVKAVSTLKNSYQTFVSSPTNALGGSSVGAGERDGNNAKIVLDALPSTYDFPALTTSLDSMLTSQGVKINTISGVDEEVAQSSNQTSDNPQPIAIPFQIIVASDYDGVKRAVSAFERSIRPYQIKTLDITGNQKELSLSVSAQTYFQPGKSLGTRTKVVK